MTEHVERQRTCKPCGVFWRGVPGDLCWCCDCPAEDSATSLLIPRISTIPSLASEVSEKPVEAA